MGWSNISGLTFYGKISFSGLIFYGKHSSLGLIFYVFLQKIKSDE